MGYENGVEEETILFPYSSFSEALLFTTMCIIGLPVDVHVKDGSVYSGIFYTASVEKDYGVVLKKAKLTKKGKSGANVANGSVIETLVILSGELVQVVAKGVLLPSDGVARSIAGDNVESVMGTVPSSEDLVGQVKKSAKFGMDKRQMNQGRTSPNENGYAHGFTLNKSVKEQEGRKMPPNHVGNAMEVEHGKINGTNVAKSEEAPSFSGNERQVGDESSQGEQDEYKQKFKFYREENADVRSSNSSLDGYLTKVKPTEEGHAKTTSKLLRNVESCDASMHLKPDDQFSERPSPTDTSLDAGFTVSPNLVVDATSESCRSSLVTSTETVPPQSSESNIISKEFKLNPGAKVFSPSFAHTMSATPPAVPTVANMTYIPSNPPMVAIAASQPEVGISPFAPRSSTPSKFVPYGNLTAGNGGNGSQFSQPIVGHMGNRAQPLRYAGQYHPVQAAPAFVNPNSQFEGNNINTSWMGLTTSTCMGQQHQHRVMIGRFGQLVYMQPVSQDLVQGAAAMSPVAAHPLLTTHQVQFQKHQGTAAGQALQLCVPQPLIASGQQPYAVPSHIPLLQPPFPPNRPIPVPGSNGLFGAKFP